MHAQPSSTKNMLVHSLRGRVWVRDMDLQLIRSAKLLACWRSLSLKHPYFDIKLAWEVPGSSRLRCRCTFWDADGALAGPGGWHDGLRRHSHVQCKRHVACVGEMCAFFEVAAVAAAVPTVWCAALLTLHLYNDGPQFKNAATPALVVYAATGVL